MFNQNSKCEQKEDTRHISKGWPVHFGFTLAHIYPIRNITHYPICNILHPSIDVRFLITAATLYLIELLAQLD